MKSYRQELWFDIPARRAFVNITAQVDECLRESGVREGLCLVNAMHITASVFINDDESGLHRDYDQWLEKLAPHEPVASYHHNRTGEDNADAHMKRQLMGREVVVAITAGKLDFGPWEQIFYGEFDGRRRKRALVKIIGEQSGPHRVFTMRPPCFHHAATVFSPCGHGVFTMRPRGFHHELTAKPRCFCGAIVAFPRRGPPASRAAQPALRGPLQLRSRRIVSSSSHV